MGDPAGVGPETIVGAWAERRLHEDARLLVVGNAAVLRRAGALLETPLEVVEIGRVEEARPNPREIPCLVAGSHEAEAVEPGQVSAAAGQAAYDAVAVAAQLACTGQIDAMVTAPLNKEALNLAGCSVPGHTELLAELCDVERTAMMLFLPPQVASVGPAGLGVVHVTLHTALAEVPAQIRRQAVVDRIELADGALRWLADDLEDFVPRIGVAALNPHAGESGLFGDEELREIAPAVAEAQQAGYQVEGPLPADTLMVRAAAGEFDAVVAMFHDQGHIALKLLDMDRAVNITLGLPIVRTSVAHGTAFDLAWQGRASTSSMTEAIQTARRLACARGRGAGHALTSVAASTRFQSDATQG